MHGCQVQWPQFSTQPPKVPALQQLAVEPVGFRPAMLSVEEAGINPLPTGRKIPVTPM
jgi:hypothetical protein